MKKNHLLLILININFLFSFNSLYSDVTNFGAIGDGIYNSTKHIQQAINYANVNKIGNVYFPSGTYMVDTTLFIYSGMGFIGDGHLNSTIKLLKNSNCDLINTINFEKLKGSNSWFDSEGVTNGFKLEKITLDGNGENQESGSNLRIYGKRYIINEVMLINSNETAFYSECGYKGGQENHYDMPESNINNLWIKDYGTTGFHYRGPHDGYINSLFISSGRGKGAFFEQQKDIFNGKCDVNFIHNYGSNQIGIEISARINAQHIISESCFKEGVYISDKGSKSSILFLELYKNDVLNSGNYYDLSLKGKNIYLGRISINENRISKGSILNIGKSNFINHLSIFSNTLKNKKNILINNNGSNFSVKLDVDYKYKNELYILNSCLNHVQSINSNFDVSSSADIIYKDCDNKNDLNIFNYRRYE